MLLSCFSKKVIFYKSCAFVDYKKAFHVVDRSSLWLKLISSGINGRVLNVVYDIYENSKSCVTVGHKLLISLYAM